MMKDTLKLSLSFVIMIIGYYILSLYLDDMVIVVGILVITIPIAIYNIVIKSSYEYQLEILCDADRYLETVTKKYVKKNESIYNLYLAYAYLYQGKFTEATLAISNIDKEIIESKAKYNKVYNMILLKLSFNEKDLTMYNTIFNNFQEVGLEKNEKIDFRVFEVPKYILEERYEEVVELLIELIPRQPQRYLIIELEYYLAIAYVKLGRLEDAIAVLEFISNKKYNIFYIEKCQEMLKEIQKEN